ncbi:hypothetical protein SDC9_146830 [bioreactor metagenome]|uniref:Uncharacterized protein n=1 Tax=bioreactor metagenome TaxID=1076179 RepID=A0A645EEU1_9ZZZZ
MRRIYFGGGDARFPAEQLFLDAVAEKQPAQRHRQHQNYHNQHRRQDAGLLPAGGAPGALAAEGPLL